jgi:hypothetical protein
MSNATRENSTMIKKVLATSITALLLTLIVSTGALAARPTSAASAAEGSFVGMRLAVTPPAKVQATAVDQLERARLQQVLALIKARQPAEVEFAGMLGRRNAAAPWTVAGVAIRSASGTAYDGVMAAGLHAHVRAQIHSDGTVEALYVRTMHPAAAAAASQHKAEWQRDDHGVHLGEPNHAADPEHSKSGQPAPQATAQPVHHQEAPAQYQQPPAHHDEGSHQGDRCSGHH